MKVSDKTLRRLIAIATDRAISVHSRMGGDIEEIFSEAMLGLSIALNRMRPDQGYNIFKRAAITINGTLIDFFRKNASPQLKQIPAKFEISFVPAFDRLEIDEIVDALKGVEWYEHREGDISVKSISQSLGIGRSPASRRLKKARQLAKDIPHERSIRTRTTIKPLTESTKQRPPSELEIKLKKRRENTICLRESEKLIKKCKSLLKDQTRPAQSKSRKPA